MLEIIFLFELFPLKAVGFDYSKPLGIRGVASFSAIALPPSAAWCGDTPEPATLPTTDLAHFLQAICLPANCQILVSRLTRPQRLAVIEPSLLVGVSPRKQRR